MTQTIIKNIIELLIVAPFIIMNLNKSNIKLKAVLLFAFFFILNQFLLELPRQIPELRIIDGNWNWSGKIYTLIGSILFYMLFRKVFIKYDFFTFKQKNNTLKPTISVTVIVVFIAIGLAFFLYGKSESNLETLLFQITMPGLDEEFAFRGIMLGLLSTSLKSKINFGSLNLGNPAILITSILFGLVHSFQLDNNWNFSQNWIYFIQTSVYGLILCWMTIKSGSILMPILSHNLTNTLGTITTWIK